MGTFLIEPTFRNPDARDRKRVVPVLVDTGATWTTLPQDVIDELGCTVLSSRRIRLEDGSEKTWPLTVVLVTLEGQELPTICLITPPGSLAVLGAITLEEFGLTVDPVTCRLMPFTGYLLCSVLHEPAAPATPSP